MPNIFFRSSHIKGIACLSCSMPISFSWQVHGHWKTYRCQSKPANETPLQDWWWLAHCETLQTLCSWLCHEAHPGCSSDHRHYSHSRYRSQYVPLTFVSLWGKSRWCNYFSGHFVFVSEKKSFRLSRKFFSVFKNAENRDLFAAAPFVFMCCCFQSDAWPLGVMIAFFMILLAISFVKNVILKR